MGGILHVLRLLRDLLEQNVLRVPAGTRDRAGLEGVGQICIAQRFEIAAAAPVLQRFDSPAMRQALSSAYFFLNSIAPIVVSV